LAVQRRNAAAPEERQERQKVASTTPLPNDRDVPDRMSLLTHAPQMDTCTHGPAYESTRHQVYCVGCGQTWPMPVEVRDVEVAPGGLATKKRGRPPKAKVAVPEVALPKREVSSAREPEVQDAGNICAETPPEKPAKALKNPKKTRKPIKLSYTLANLESLVRTSLVSLCAEPGCRQELRVPIAGVAEGFCAATEPSKVAWTLTLADNGTLPLYCRKHSPVGRGVTSVRFVEETF
jgi:hypothetical protein